MASAETSPGQQRGNGTEVAGGGLEAEQTFVPTARFDPRTGDIVVHQKPRLKRVIESGVNNGLLRFLVSYPEAVVPHLAVSQYLQTQNVTTAAVSAVEALKFAMRLGVTKYYSRGQVTGFELPGSIRESLSTSLAQQNDERAEVVSEEVLSRGIQVSRTGVIVARRGFCNPEMRVVGNGRSVLVAVPEASAEYLGIIGEAGRAGIPGYAIAERMGYDKTAPVTGIYKKTRDLLEAAPAIPERFFPDGRTPLHRLVINPARSGKV